MLVEVAWRTCGGDVLLYVAYLWRRRGVLVGGRTCGGGMLVEVAWLWRWRACGGGVLVG